MKKQIAKWFTGAALAAAFLVAAPHKAEAQVAFGVQVGAYPAYGYGNGYAYDDLARRRWIEHQQWEAARAAEWRHEQWEQQRFYDRACRRDGWRDRDYGYRGWR